MRTERARLQDFRIFMMQQRKIGHRSADFLSVKESYYAGWDAGYHECVARTGYMNLMLTGVVFMLFGWAMQL